MKSRSAAKAFGLAVVLGLACAGVTAAKADPSLEYRAQALAVHDIAVGQEGGGQDQQGPGEGRIPLFGKITAVNNRAIEMMNANGDNVTIKLTDKTEFRKDRQPAKRNDFKVGDLILVRGEQNADQTWTAQVVAARSMNGDPGGPGGRGRGESGMQAGTLGKDFVAGVIKSVDAPKLTVQRTDDVTQTIELNEDTSLHKDRDAITMADIQPGDHVFARGAMQNDVFVPKSVMVVPEAQWKRMQEWSQGAGGGQRRRPAGNSAPSGTGTDAGSAPSEPGAPGPPPPPPPPTNSDTQKPPEPQI